MKQCPYIVFKKTKVVCEKGVKFIRECFSAKKDLKEDAAINVIEEQDKQEIITEDIHPDTAEKRPDITDAPDVETLLDNSAFIKLVEECVEIMNEFDGYANRVQSEEDKMIIKLMLERLQESMERCGLERIDNEQKFMILRHVPVPMSRVPQGQFIKEFIFPGLCLKNRVFRKAKVTIQ